MVACLIADSGMPSAFVRVFLPLGCYRLPLSRDHCNGNYGRIAFTALMIALEIIGGYLYGMAYDCGRNFCRDWTTAYAHAVVFTIVIIDTAIIATCVFQHSSGLSMWSAAAMPYVLVVSALLSMTLAIARVLFPPLVRWWDSWLETHWLEDRRVLEDVNEQQLGELWLHDNMFEQHNLEDIGLLRF